LFNLAIHALSEGLVRRKDAFVGFFSWYIDKANVFEEAA